MGEDCKRSRFARQGEGEIVRSSVLDILILSQRCQVGRWVYRSRVQRKGIVRDIYLGVIIK